MYRTSVILRHTFVEAVAQPVFWLVTIFGAAVLVVFAMLPFFTLGEDTRMFKSVAVDVILLLTLIATLLATSRSIFEEIEDRTMLTLMSKPVGRWEVLVGKYLGLIAAAAVMVAILGTVLLICTYYRVPTDYQLNTKSLYAEVQKDVRDTRAMHMSGVYAGMVLVWLQVSVLAAISVAISTRVSFVVNLPVVILIYLAGNLTRFVGGATADGGPILLAFGWGIETLLPFLSAFDLRDLTVFADVGVPGTRFAGQPGTVGLGQVWVATAMAALYAACYATAALAAGMLLFRNRELGGADG